MSITAPRNTDSPATRRSVRTTAATAASLLVLATLSAGFSAPAHAADDFAVSFQYKAVIDATPVGGNEATPLRLTYRIDRNLPPSNGDGVTWSAYEPLAKLIVELGDECVALSGAGASIDVFNDAGEPASDYYGIVAVAPAVTGKKLAGRDIDVVQFVLADLDSTMFSDTALPTSADFAASADFSQNLILLDRDLLFSEGAFQFSAYDPAGALAAIQADLVGLQLNAGVNASLQNRLTKVAGYIDGMSSKGNAKAEQELRGFIAQVQGLSGTGIPSGDAARLIAAATNLIDQLPACS
ncbi:hypothetical protein [Arthrobacter sp. ISL-5]|uniref:hypothetical protein n=1 Tax=Arthrobacter sp. ISL-5 TaxID=2819111 RepID=UPI001BE75F13|nr:hypothetical protein [Arthrobacter sp. ISL-5]MBT2556084.1 hypothetical protein [Arthrobacter sp. ISL-5]